MKTHILLFLSLAVAVSLPVQDWVPVESLVEAQRERNPLLADVLPEQGHVVQEDLLPVARKESSVLEKHAEPQPEQQNEPVKAKSLVEDVPVEKEKAEAEEVVKETELKEEPVMVEPRDQKQAPTEQVENIPPLNEMPETAEEDLTEEEPVTELETENEKALVDVLKEEALMEAEEPVMGLEAVPDVQEIHEMNPNGFAGEPVMELEPENERASAEEEINVMQEEALMEAEEPMMELEPVPDMQEIHEMNPNGFAGEPVMEQEPENERASAEEERNVMQEEALMEAEEPVMEPEPVPDMQEVHEMNPNGFAGEPVMYLEPENEKASGEEERNVMQEEALMEAEEPVMELEPVLDMQEVHEMNPYEFVEEPLMEPEEDERNAFQKEALLEAGYLAEEAIEPYSEGAERSAMLNMEPEYQMAEDPMLQFEPSQEFSMQEHLQRKRELAESKMMESQMGEEELMMADQSYMEDFLENDHLKTNERAAAEEETVQKERSNNGWQTCSGVVISGKCYQFFRGPKRAADAEFFCQENFPNGHLASVTSSYIHSHMVGLMDRNGGRTRTWIGGLRYLDTGSFIWLDGEHWSYADWLPGEPNNTAGVENCVELLSNGKFNDMPCWDLRAFICSYPY